MCKSFWLAALAVLLLIAPSMAQAQARITGIDVANMDPTVSPREDFYRFANGGWLDRTEIPTDKSSFGTFTELYDLTTDQLLAILHDATSGERRLIPGSDEAKAVQMWKQGVDVEARNANGITPIVPFLAEIDALGSLEDIYAYQQDALFRGLRGLLPIRVSPDLKDSSVKAVYLGGPWLGLPNRDYYFDEGNEAVIAAYVDTNAKLLERIGIDAEDAEQSANAVFALEKRLAETTLTREQKQDPALSYNPHAIAELARRYPGMNWQAYLEELDIPTTERIIVTEANYLDALGAILAETPIETLRDYLRLQLMWNYYNNLDLETEEIAFAFIKSLGGQSTLPPLEERVLSQVNGLMGDALGKLYVADHFPPEAKVAITDLVESIITAFGERLEENTWMTPQTRERALQKLGTLRVKVGYPEKWETYEDVKIGDSYFASVVSAATMQLRESLAEAGLPVDREEWGMNAQTANAYYSPLNNEIVFPAAILQPPFFAFRAEAAANYGAIGFVIGHEITHGFDLAGSKFDQDGNLADWWTAEDRQRFEALNDELIAQYDQIEVLPGEFINGQITVTENVADLGGIETAYDALQTTLASEGETPIPEQGLPYTPEQQFFIAAATVWRGEMRDEALLTRIRSGVHAPPAVRATQPLRNMDEFHEAFGIREGDPMYLAPEDRVRIW